MFFSNNNQSTYPPAPNTFSQEEVESVRRQRISAAKRRFGISIALQLAFTIIFAALLGYYLSRDYGFNYDNGYRWYIWLLVALLVVDVLCVLFTIWQLYKNLKWLKSPTTPPHLLMWGVNPHADYNTTIVMQPVNGSYYQQPPPQHQQGGYYQQQPQYPPPSHPPPQEQNRGQQQPMYMPPSSPPPPHSPGQQGYTSPLHQKGGNNNKNPWETS